jgi:hypothetical protein
MKPLHGYPHGQDQQYQYEGSHFVFECLYEVSWCDMKEMRGEWVRNAFVVAEVL